jgi:hypothetical protein
MNTPTHPHPKTMNRNPPFWKRYTLKEMALYATLYTSPVWIIGGGLWVIKTTMAILPEKPPLTTQMHDGPMFILRTQSYNSPPVHHPDCPCTKTPSR